MHTSVTMATSAITTHLMGKLTMVGFFSMKKLFLVNLCECKCSYVIETMQLASQPAHLNEENEVGRQLGDLKSLDVRFTVSLVLLRQQGHHHQPCNITPTTNMPSPLRHQTLSAGQTGVSGGYCCALCHPK